MSGARIRYVAGSRKDICEDKSANGSDDRKSQRYFEKLI